MPLLSIANYWALPYSASCPPRSLYCYTDPFDAYAELMFSLVIIKDIIKLSPSKLCHDFVEIITLSLNRKYCNRVIIKVGLAISVLDLLEAGDPYVHPGEASAHIKVKFRLIIFRPLLGQVLVGRIRSSSEEGLHISMGFFDDILVPPSCMPADTTFDPQEQVWVWTFEGSTRMYLDHGESIRFRVLNEQFEEAAPLSKEVLMATRTASLSSNNPSDGDTVLTKQPAPYRLMASIAEDGLGLTRWWQASEPTPTEIIEDTIMEPS